MSFPLEVRTTETSLENLKCKTYVSANTEMNYRAITLVIIGGIAVAGVAVQPAAAGATAASVDAGPTDGPGPYNEEPAEGSSEGTGLLHLGSEVVQILFAVAAVASVVLAGRAYGGELGRALLVSGVGVTLFAAQRLWHNLHELGLIGQPSSISEQGLFILAAGALAAGYLSMYRTMNKRMG